MKLLSWQTALLTRLILMLTLLFIIPIGLASAIGSTIPSQNVLFTVGHIDDANFHPYVSLMDIRAGLITKLYNDTFFLFGLWSPNGQQIAYYKLGIKPFVWDMDSNRMYSLSPLDTSLWILGWATATDTILLEGNSLHDLYLVKSDGADFRALPIPPKAFPNRSDVSISPDSRFVVFSGYTSEEDDYEIYRLDLAENKLTQLTNSPESRNYDIRLSPDGRQIAYLTAVSTGFEISVMNADGSNQRQITNSGDIQGRPKWSPDGTHLLFRSAIDANFPYALYIMNADGTNQKRLVNSISENGSYSWSPDGNHILYEVEILNQRNLYMISSDGGEPRLLYGKASEWVSFSSWRPQP
jgi:Tol biopolymer transport system component